MSLRPLIIGLLLIAVLAGIFGVVFVRTPPIPLIKAGKLTVADTLGDIVLPAGPYELLLTTGNAPRFEITSRGRSVFKNKPGESPFHALRDKLIYRQSHGMTTIKEDRKKPCADLTLLSVARMGTRAERGLSLTGLFTCPDGPVELFLKFQAAETGALAFEARLGEGALSRGYTGIRLIGESSADEHFFGFGAQMSRVNMKGERFPLIVTEQGIGRGVEPLSTIADLLYGGAAGKWHSAYAPVPATITDKRRGAFLATHATIMADLRDDKRFAFSTYADRVLGGFLSGEPLEMISDLTLNTGRQRALPDWAMKGVILGLQGGTQSVLEKLNTVKGAGAPVSALWLQDWVGQRKTSFGEQLWWSWTLDQTRYPGWDILRRDLEKEGISLLGYINPFLVDTEPYEAETGEKRRNLFKEALAAGYLVTRADGSLYPITITDFDAGMLDLSNPRAIDWFKRVVKDEISKAGLKGWMADFGESLPVDAKLANGSAPLFHNAYPDIWAHVNRQIVEELELDEEAFVFHRSGHFGSAGRAPIFWLGDQLVTWDDMDGFKSAIIGHVTSGFSGHGVTHADIGGYTTISSPIKDYHRSKELLLRWAEFAAFTALFRTHEGNQPSNNHQAYSDQDTAQQFAKMATLFACLAPARRAANEDLRDKGWPIVRHPVMHYPNNKKLADIRFEQIMLGGDVMMAPVTEPGADTVTIILPEDGWYHLWSGDRFDKGTHRVVAPMGQPAGFIHSRSPYFSDLMACGAKAP